MVLIMTVSDTDDLKEPPIFTKELHDMEVKDGDRVEMSVEVKGQCVRPLWPHGYHGFLNLEYHTMLKNVCFLFHELLTKQLGD